MNEKLTSQAKVTDLNIKKFAYLIQGQPPIYIYTNQEEPMILFYRVQQIVFWLHHQFQLINHQR